MTPPAPQLLAALSVPAVASLSDADAATAVNTPVYTPRTGTVTRATLNNAAVWGFAKTAAFTATIKAANNPSADNVLALLDGTGFDPADPQASGIAAGMVALGGGTIDAADATLALNTVSYPAGSGTVAVADVTAARAYVAAQAQAAATRATVAQKLNAGTLAVQSAVDAAVEAGTPLTDADAVAAFAAAYGEAS